MERVREVSVRKVMGAVRPQLISQFLGESLVMGLVALMLAAGIAEIAFRIYLNDLLGTGLSIFEVFTVQHMGIAMAGLVVLTVIAGMYPAFILSQYRPASIL